MNFNLPHAIGVVVLITTGLFLGMEVAEAWRTTHNLPDVIFVTGISLGVLTSGWVALRQMR